MGLGRATFPEWLPRLGGRDLDDVLSLRVNHEVRIRDARLGILQLVIQLVMVAYVLVSLARGSHLKEQPLQVQAIFRPDVATAEPTASAGGPGVLPCAPRFSLKHTLPAHQAARLSSYLNSRGVVTNTPEYVNDSYHGTLVDDYMTFGAQLLGVWVEGVDIVSQRSMGGFAFRRTWHQTEQQAIGFNGQWGMFSGGKYYPLADINESSGIFRYTTGQIAPMSLHASQISITDRLGNIVEGVLTSEGEIVWNSGAFMYRLPWVRLPSYTSARLVEGQPLQEGTVALHDVAGNSDVKALLRELTRTFVNRRVTLLYETVNRYPCFGAQAEQYMLVQSPKFMTINTAVRHKVSKHVDCIAGHASLPVQHGGHCRAEGETQHLGTSVLAIPEDATIALGVYIEGVKADAPLRGRVASCEPLTHICGDDAPIELKTDTWLNVSDRSFTLPLRDLLQRARIGYECQHSRACGIWLNLHVTNSLRGSLLDAMTMQERELGDVSFQVQVYSQGMHAGFTQGDVRPDADLGFSQQDVYLGVGVELTSSSEVWVFTWTGLLTYLGASTGLFAIATTMLRNALGCCGRRSTLYSLYTAQTTVDFSYIEGTYAREHHDSDVDKALTAVSEKLLRQQLTVGGTELTRSHSEVPSLLRGSPDADDSDVEDEEDSRESKSLNS